jgi:hypothetical protein
MAPESTQQSLPFYLSDASFWIPHHIVRSGWLQNAPLAFWMIDALRPSIFVELGTHNGFSYLCFCQAVDTLRTNTQCFAVDTWEGDKHSGFYDGDVLTDLRSRHDGAYGRFSRLVQSTFDEAADHFADKSIDLLHIDGRHFYDDVKHDFETWLPKLSQRAVVMVHDTNVRERDFGVDSFWEELKEAYPTFTIRDEHGLGIAGVGANQSDRLSMLFQANLDQELESEIRRVYQRLGWAITSAYRASDLEIAHESSQRTGELLGTQLDEQITNLEHLHERLNEAQGQLLEYQQRIQVLEQEFAVSGQSLRSAEEANTVLNQNMQTTEEANATLAVALERADAVHHKSLSRENLLRAELDQLRNDLNAIYTSKSWKLMALQRNFRLR